MPLKRCICRTGKIARASIKEHNEINVLGGVDFRDVIYHVANYVTRRAGCFICMAFSGLRKITFGFEFIVIIVIIIIHYFPRTREQRVNVSLNRNKTWKSVRRNEREK